MSYDPKITAQKAAGDGGAVALGGTVGAGVGALVVATLRSRALSPWPEGLDTVAVGLVATGVGAVVAVGKRAWRNFLKHRGVSLVLVALLALSGCVTTTATDGTVVQRLDTRGLLEVYRLYLEQEEVRPPAAPPVEVTIEGVPVDLGAVKDELKLRGIAIPGE